MNILHAYITILHVYIIILHLACIQKYLACIHEYMAWHIYTGTFGTCTNQEGTGPRMPLYEIPLAKLIERRKGSLYLKSLINWLTHVMPTGALNQFGIIGYNFDALENLHNVHLSGETFIWDQGWFILLSVQSEQADRWCEKRSIFDIIANQHFTEEFHHLQSCVLLELLDYCARYIIDIEHLAQPTRGAIQYKDAILPVYEFPLWR